MCIFNLQSKKEQYITNCKSFKISKGSSNNWLVYQNSNKDLIAYNFSTGEKKIFSGVIDYSTVIMEKHCWYYQEREILKKKSCAQWVDLFDNKIFDVWKEVVQVPYTFDQTGTKLAFIGRNRIGTNEDGSIWYYRESRKKSTICVSSEMSWRKYVDKRL